MQYGWCRYGKKGKLINEVGQEEDDKNLEGFVSCSELLLNNRQYFSFNLFFKEMKIEVGKIL